MPEANAEGQEWVDLDGEFGQVRSLGDLLRDDDLTAPPEPVVEGLIFRGRVTMVAGREKAGKSTFAGAMTAAVTRGAEFVGRKTKQGRVVYIGGFDEPLGDAVARLVEFRADHARIGHTTAMEDPLDHYEEVVTEIRPDLVVIDSLTSWVVESSQKAPGSSDPHAWAAVMNRVARLARENNVAVLILHHTVKSGVEEYRGSTSIGAGVDGILHMRQGKRGVRSIKGIIRRVGEMSLSLLLENGEFREARRPSKAKKGKREENQLEMLDVEVIRYVATSQSAPSKNNVRDNVPGSNDAIDKAVRRLIEAGLLRDANAEGRGMELEVVPR